MEQKKKVDKILKTLNHGLKTPVWFPVDGLNTMLSLESGISGLDVNTNRGLTLKAFINEETHEIKTYFMGDI